VVWRPARLGRSRKRLLEPIEQFKARDVALVSLNEQIDMSSANGRLSLVPWPKARTPEVTS
jgi:DNA invertase Pin-like site-specific DNA recombinase